MIYWEILKMALGSLRVNKLRSALTLLGVIIGVTSVITIISALEGLSQSIQSEIDKMGPATFVVNRFGMAMSHDEFMNALKRKPIEYEYLKAIEEGCSECVKTSVSNYDRVELKYRNRKLRNVLINGTTSTLLDIVDYEVDQGRFHSAEDDNSRRRVAFIGYGVKEELYPNVDPIGKEVKINNIKYEIIGIAKKQGSTFGQNRDNVVFIPYLAYKKDFQGHFFSNLEILVKGRSVATLDVAMDQVRTILRAYRNVPYDKDDDFGMITAEAIMDIFNNITRYIRLGLIGVTSISLIVGGIIIMNIMMVSVTERTREIGIRKSIGAKQKDILWQFLFESLVLSLGGGIIGITIGVILGDVLINLINMNMTPSIYAIVLGLGISSGVGLFFGIYPAMKAARLQPVKALSYE